MPALLTVAILIDSPALLQSLRQLLVDDRYSVKSFTAASDFLEFVEQEKHEIDCLIFQANRVVLPVVESLYQQGTILPAIFLSTDGAEGFACADDRSSAQIASTQHWPDFLYHSSEIFITATDLANISTEIDEALSKFLNLTLEVSTNPADADLPSDPESESAGFLLQQQQRRLAEKLKERLGYLAVYYNRSSNHFFRNLPLEQRQDLLTEMKEQYRQILLLYFTPDNRLNDLLDQFVTAVFFADLSVSEVVEMHMNLMDDFAKQLKLEGWSEDILLDYRLTLIDVIAHLCEMYRRSVPRQES